MKIIRSLRWICSIAIAAGIITSIGHAQELIQNGDLTANASLFTNGIGYYGSGNPVSPTDWTTTGSGLNGPGTPVYSGYMGWAPVSLSINTGGTVSVFAFLQQGGATLSQSFDVVAGETYEVTYDAGARKQASSINTSIVAKVTDGVGSGGTLLFDQSGELSDSEFYANTTPDLLTTSVGVGATFIADETGLVTLTFSNLYPPGGAGSDYTVDLADISVEEVPGAVPEPASFFLTLIGLGFFALCLQKRRLLSGASVHAQARSLHHE